MGCAWDSSYCAWGVAQRKMHVPPIPPPTDTQLQYKTMSHDMMEET